MQVRIRPSSINGTIQAPASKSSMQRACAAALLSKGVTIIKNPGRSNDDLSALEVIVKLGAEVLSQHPELLKINSSGVHPIAHEINCGESGLGIRMFAPIAALSNEEIIINGEGSLLQRPMHFFDEIFPKLGIKIQSNNGRLPIRIKGPLHPVDIDIDGSLSSQFLTGLLMAFAAAGAENVSINVKDLKSKPYIDLTLQVMKHFGIEIENRNYQSFYFKSGNDLQISDLQSRTYTVEGDWSGAAFLLVAGAIAGNIRVKGLDIASTQADKVVLKALASCGAKLSVQQDQIEIGSTSLTGFDFDATDCPDLFPPLVALASFCTGITSLKGVSRLLHKESNRALTLKEEFGKMGVDIRLEDDLMLIKGNQIVIGAGIYSHHDHRIAMACAVAALKARGETTIEDGEAINKSYPDFYEHLRILGASVSLSDQLINH